jgi:hypothetical protein
MPASRHQARARAGRDLVVAGKFLDIGDNCRVATRRLAHGGVDGVACFRESIGGQAAETAGRTGDDDDLFHDT